MSEVTTKEEMLEKEIEGMMDVLDIKELELKNFIRNVMNEFGGDDKQMAHYREGLTVARKAKAVLEQEKMESVIVQVICTGALLARTYVTKETYRNSHVIEFDFIVRERGLDEGLSQMYYQGINRTVRGSMGPDTPIADFEPKPGQPEYLVSLLYRLEGITRGLE
ncbi:hypothetical protein ACQR3P_29355 [Rhodococcus sp. IEGM1300]